MTVPLMLVGGIRSFSVAQKLIEQGNADYIALCRPLTREPGLINCWQSGDTSRATCISCQKCFVPTMKGEGLKCVEEEKIKKKITYYITDQVLCLCDRMAPKKTGGLPGDLLTAL